MLKKQAYCLCIFLIALLFAKTSYAEEITGIEIEYSFLGTKIDFDYDDEWFNVPSSEYSQRLAVTSLGLAMSTFTTGSEGVEKMLGDMHFEKLYHNAYYDEATEANGCGVGLGSKKLGDTTLVAVAIRSGRYGLEWSGNFTTGSTEIDHKGFADARDIVLSELLKYLEENVETKKVKFWITGFSRGAAVANLLSAYLIKDRLAGYDYVRDNIYSYCFETPANTVNTEPALGYENIFNIIDPNDLVPKIPPALWGFTRYGKNVYIPEKGVNPDYDKYYEDYLREYVNITGMKFGGKLPEDDEQFEVINRCITVLASIMRNRENYSLLYQDIITGLIENGTDGINYYKLFLILYQSYNDIMLDKDGKPNTENLEGGFKYLGNHLTEFGSALLNHTPILVLSWMKALESTDVMKNCIEDNSAFSESKYSAVYLRVYGDVACSFHEENNTDEIPGYIDEEGAKVYLLPWGKEVTLRLEADKETNVYVCMSSYALDSALCNRAMEYKLKIDDNYAEMSAYVGENGTDCGLRLISDNKYCDFRELKSGEAMRFLPYDKSTDITWEEVETETGTEKESETETGTEKETETETETVTEYETEAETVKETEYGTEAETDKRPEFETDTETTEPVIDDGSSNKTTNIYMIFIIVVVAICGLAGITIVLRNKK